jgi:hypothetical protein
MPVGPDFIRVPGPFLNREYKLATLYLPRTAMYNAAM